MVILMRCKLPLPNNAENFKPYIKEWICEAAMIERGRHDKKNRKSRANRDNATEIHRDISKGDKTQVNQSVTV